MRGGCQCDYPKPKGWRPNECVQCGRSIDPAYVSSDTTVEEFFSHLASIPGVDPGFIQQARDREKAGRDTFGMKYLGNERNNPAEAREEAADLAMYLHLHLLKCYREGQYEDVATAMEAAAHAAAAWKLLARLRE